MATYIVEVARPINEKGTMTIEAASLEEAWELAETMAMEGDLDDVEWDDYFGTESWGVVLDVTEDEDGEDAEDEDDVCDQEAEVR